MKRRLTAIMAADVVGYSRLMGADESGTFLRVMRCLDRVVRPRIERHGGRIFKLIGDGVLAEFPSVRAAVVAAVEIQHEMPIFAEEEEPAEEPLHLRIGINLGDLIAMGEDLYGEGVNVAARVEALAEPGGICITRPVRDQIRDKLGYELEDLGDISVKNIARP
ncbi:MAG: adenylate/guanylate cyclase domain-containing protein, partial [Pseudomonadota bacterium]